MRRIKKLYSQGLLVNSGKERKAASLDIQKRGVIEAQAECEALQGAREILQAELDELEKEKLHSELFDSYGKSYNRAMAECEELHERITARLKSLQCDLNEFNSGVLSLIKNQEEARSSFGVLHNKVDLGLSLRSFLNGEILEADENDRESVTQEVREKIMQISDVPYEEIEAEFAAFQDAMEMLRQLRKFVAANIKRAAFVYTPTGKATLQVDATTRQADRSMDEEMRNRIRQNPTRFDDQTKRKYGIARGRHAEI